MPPSSLLVHASQNLFDGVVRLDYHLVTLKVWPKTSGRGNEFQRHLLYHLVVLPGIMEYAAGVVDEKLVFPFLLYEG